MSEKTTQSAELQKLVQKLHPLERKTLVKVVDGTSHTILSQETGLQEIEVMRALQWLENKQIITMEIETSTHIHLEENGELALNKGLPEDLFLTAIKNKPLTLQEISKQAKLDMQETSACIGLLKKTGAIELAKDKTISITEQGTKQLQKPSLEKQLLEKMAKKPLLLSELAAEEKHAFDNLTKRKAYVKKIERKERIVHLTKLGIQLKKEDLTKEYAERITPEDLKTGAWREKEYRAYDVTINVPQQAPGKPHFVNESINYIKQIWLELGFKEMKGDMVQTALWCLDSLFVPQDHPAREMQDTFYLETNGDVEQDVYEKVKSAHETGGDTGSDGWGYQFSKEETQQNMLRTHTTGLSAQTLYKIQQGYEQLPGKFFSVGKVFRNEALDWKHLFEFYQVEGIVVDPDAHFGHLLGYLEMFFKKLGYAKIRIRPAHFPYTEPSVEVDGWHEKKQCWVELGGAGLFRPEVTKTLLGKEIPVLAWGLGMERSISEYFDITDIRELYNNDIKQLRTIKKWVK